MVAPTLGGVLTDLIDWRAVFWFTALAGLLICLLVFFALPETLPRSALTFGVGALLRGFWLCLGSARYRAYMGHAAASSMIFFAFISAAPYLMVNTLGQGATAYGMWFIIISLGYMGGNLLAVRLSGRYPVLALMLAGSTLAVLGIALAALLALWGPLTPAGLFLPIALSMIGSGLAAPNAQAGAINVFPERAGTASGLTSFLQMFVAGLATQAVGVAQNGTPWPMLGAMALGSTVALGCIAWAYRLEA
jgi:DHA1 family bicyclomycin/chloramphenicol resistance-like MFS transporter